MQAKAISLRGVRVHNLRNIDVAIPLHRLTVVTGVSGAGKSSLVFDTLYAEAQRRYLQSFSTHTRQFLERFDKPDVEEISDLPPAIAIRAGQASARRGTVAAVAEIDVDLRLLFARAGTLYCPGCGQAVTAFRADDVLAQLLELPAGTRVTLAFPASLRDETDQSQWRSALLEEGYFRIQVGGSVYRLGEQDVLAFAPSQRVWVLLDRVEVGKTTPARIRESIESAYRRGAGRLAALTDGEERVFDQRPYCPRCDRVFATPDPRALDGVDLRLGGRSIADMGDMTLRELLTFVADWQSTNQPPAADTHLLTSQIRERLEALIALSLGYLPLDQSATTLSDGEFKRIALASALASNLVQVLYLIDEPASELHPSEIEALQTALLRLRERGNTVVVIEHERTIIAAADHVIDLGPGAGEEGGTVVYQGPPAGLATAGESPTSDFWTGRDTIDEPTRRRKPAGLLQLHDAHRTIDFPLGVLCVVTGPSGAGKRRLVEQLLYPALTQSTKKAVTKGQSLPVRVTGGQRVTDVVLLDQAPIARSARSNPATYLKIFDEVRQVFADTVDARIRNYGPGAFSFNQPGGRCETCEGQGTMTVDMQFLADVISTCPECHGRRYRKEILDIKVRTLSIAEVLDLTIREAFRFFRAQPKIEKKLKWMLDVGLEYLRLGQTLETLSPSEAQRLKWAGHLASSRKPGRLFLITMPSAGLHPAGVANLLACFDRLLAEGHSLIVIDNNPNLEKCADELIKLESRL